MAGDGPAFWRIKMAEPNSALGFEDMIIAIAEKLGIVNYTSDGRMYVPTTRGDLSDCKRMAINAMRMVATDGPKNGWRWMRRLCPVTFALTYTGTASSGSGTTLVDDDIEDSYDDDFFNTYTIFITAGTGKDEYATVTNYTGASGTFEFTALSGGSTPDTTTKYTIARSTDAIDGDGARYMLPANFGGMVDGNIEYAANTSHGDRIDWCDESVIRSRRATTINTGYPMLAAIRPYQPTSEALAATRRWEIILDPRPAAADVVQFPYTLNFSNMKLESGIVTSVGSGADVGLTLLDSTRTEPDDFFLGWVAKIVSGTGIGSYATVTDYTKTGGKFTVADWLDEEGAAGGTDPAADSVYVVQPAANLHPAGFIYDDLMLAACLARTEMDAQDEHMDNFWQDQYRGMALPAAHKMDAKSAPRKLGNMDGRTGPVRERIRLDVTSDYDV